MYDISRYGTLSSIQFEKSIKDRGARYVFQLHDDWFSVPGWREAALERVRLADMVGGLTSGLVESIKNNCPFSSPIIMRGAIDVERLYPAQKPNLTQLPKVVWTGNPANLKEIPNVQTLLAEVYSQKPYNLTIISGNERPHIDLPIPWEWLPYDEKREAERISGACAGLAPLEDSPYARCKDVFKVKTYMACGVPPIATAIGNNLDVIRDSKTGYLVTTSKEWETRLYELVSNPTKAHLMGQAARAECVARFSHEAIIPEWIDALENTFGPIRN
jgi:glycosyltransferase involved in cell wall biosynthesis